MSRRVKETVEQLPLSEMKPFPNHPFLVRDDALMEQLVDSIREVGVLFPALVRRAEDGGYQLISGHRRKHACERLGFATMPVIVKDVDTVTATILMVDSNFQRERILPSEKARAYKMKLDALKRQGARSDLTSVQPGQKLDGRTTRDAIAQNSPDSATQIQRYIRLNELCPTLLQMVDEGRIALTPAVELSYLRPEEQALLLITMDSEQATPSLSQAQRMKKLSQAGELGEDRILEIMLEQKKPNAWNVSLPVSRLEQYFPGSYTPREMQEVIFLLLDRWHRANEKGCDKKERPLKLRPDRASVEK